MKKSTTRGMILLAVLLAVFSVIAFVIPFPKNTVFWIAYLCGVFAILFQFLIFKTSFGRPDARSRFYGFPIARLGLYYLIIQMVVSIATIALARFLPSWVVIVLNVLILAVALIGCITTETMREEIAAQDGKLRKSVAGIRSLQSLTAALPGMTEDPELKRALQRMADEFRYSDPVSSDRTVPLEEEMHARIEDLRQAVVEGDTQGAGALCDKLTEILKERNRICAVNK